MARQITRKNTKPVLSGGFLSKFRRRIRTQTQKIMNRNPLGYIAQFKKAFPDGNIGKTGYKYIILDYGETLEKKPLPEGEVIGNITVDDIHSILDKQTTYNNKTQVSSFNITALMRNVFNKLWSGGKIGILSTQPKLQTQTQKYLVTYRSNYIDIANEINKNTQNIPVRIFIYKPSSQEQLNAGNTIQSSSSRSSRRSSRRSSIRRRSVSSHQ